MDTNASKELRAAKARIIADMTSWMKFGLDSDDVESTPDPDHDAGYEQQHVDNCSSILDEFLSAMAACKGPDDVLPIVKRTIFALNDLNSQVGGFLIETLEREELCTLIDMAARAAGLDVTGDITEKWRRW